MVRKDSRSRVFGAPRVQQALLLLAAVDFGIVACGRSNVWYPADAFEGGEDVGGVGGASTGGKGGFTTGATGGSFTGGTGGTTGGNFSTGGGITGGTGGGFSGGTGGFMSGGTAGSGGMGQGPFPCMGLAPTCNTFSDFYVQSGVTWGSGSFTGGVAVFGNGISVTDGPALHVTGVVEDYGAGIMLWFSSCGDLTPYKGIGFTASGVTTAGSLIEVMPLMNADYPWQPAPEFHRGACTASSAANAWAECLAPVGYASLSDLPQELVWSMFYGGYPVGWDTFNGPRNLVGIEWHFPYNPSQGAYVVDMTLDDVRFIGGSTECVAGMAGMGGMGGMAGVGGVGGSAVAGEGGEGGMAGGGAIAGMGGSLGGMGGSTGGVGGSVSGAGGTTGGVGGGVSGAGGSTGGVGGTTGGVGGGVSGAGGSGGVGGVAGTGGSSGAGGSAGSAGSSGTGAEGGVAQGGDGFGGV